MRFLEAKSVQEGGVAPENKMRSGSRPGQQNALRPSNPVPMKAEVRDLANQLGVDLTLIHGSGPNGEATLKDVRNAKAKLDKAPENK